MEKLLTLLFLALFLITPTLAQNSNNLERSIKKGEIELARSEREFEIKKKRQIFELEKEIKKQTILAQRSDDAAEIDKASMLVKNLRIQVDSLRKSTVKDDIHVQEKSKFLYDLQQSKQLPPAKETNTANLENLKQNDSKSSEAVTKQADRTIPVEISRYHTKRRGNSNNLRRDEIVLTKVEQNMNSVVIPGAPQGGLKVIFENLYIYDVEYILKSSNGFTLPSYTLSPKQRLIEYLIPDKYIVETWINGHKSGEARTLTVNGTVHNYKGETCFGTVVTPRFR